MVFQAQALNPKLPKEVDSAAFHKYVKSLVTMSPATLKTYRARLYPLIDYLEKELKTTPDAVIADIKTQKKDQYDFLSDYAAYLKGEKKVSDNFLRDVMTTSRSFLEFHKIYFNDRQLRATVRMPRPARRNKEPLDKADVVNILQNIHDSSMHLYTLMLAATGMRAKEALSLRLRNLDLESNPGKVHIEAEFTKTKTDRHVFMTGELKRTIQNYLKQKYALRVMRVADKKNKIRKRAPFQLERDENDLLFAAYNTAEKREPNINTLYIATVKKFNKVIDGIGTWKRERHSGFREVTRHTFRRFVKSTISDLGYADFSEWFIGHIGSTYYRKKENEKIEIFRKIEPYLTFFDVVAMEAKGADQGTKIEVLQAENVKLKRDMENLYALLYASGVIKKE